MALLRAGLPVEIGVHGASMWPLVRAGDRVWIEPAQAVRVGSLVAYVRAGRLVVHRVARLTTTQVFVRGDAAGELEAPLLPAEVLGVVTRHRLHEGLRIDHAGRWVRAGDRLAAWLHPVMFRPMRGLRRLVTALRGSGAATQPDEERVEGVVGEQEMEAPPER